MAPERRRIVIIGAGAAGITAALHLGAHSLLLERRLQVDCVDSSHEGPRAEGGSHDRKSSFPLGPARPGVAGTQDAGADRDRQGVSAWERQAVANSCAPDHGATYGEAGEGCEPVVVARWIPPSLEAADEGSSPVNPRESLQSLVPLLRGELRLGARVTRISPAARRIELSDGHVIIYDKLLSSVEPIALVGLLQPELPARIRSHQGLMYWLAARDVELLDDTTQLLYGDVTPFAAGRRVAETIKRALVQKFRPVSENFVAGEKLFKPRLVRSSPPSAAAI